LKVPVYLNSCSRDSTLVPHVGLSLATVIHSLSCPFSSSISSVLRVVTEAWRLVCCCLPACLEYGHHAPSIRLGDLDSSIALSLEIHRHLRTSVIDSIVGEFPEVILTVSFMTRCSATSPIGKWHILRRELWWNPKNDAFHLVRSWLVVSLLFCSIPLSLPFSFSHFQFQKDRRSSIFSSSRPDLVMFQASFSK
jgi:hypothetical protein